MKRSRKNKKRGFTIIEIMIAISVFLVVITIGMGSLLNAHLLHQKSDDFRSIMDNLSFIMEDMANNLRTGSSYHCVDDDHTLSGSLAAPLSGNPSNDNECWGIAFEYQEGDPDDLFDQWVYYLDNDGKLWKTTEWPYDPGDSGSRYYQLTPDEVKLTSNTRFIISGAEAGDNKQPYVVVRLVGTITSKGVATPFSLQTSVSQRLIDVE